MLLGARGNSGVLLSQYYRGIANALTNKTTLTVNDFVNSLVSGYKTSYAACNDPREGTILTVQREGIENVRTFQTYPHVRRA